MPARRAEVHERAAARPRRVRGALRAPSSSHVSEGARQRRRRGRIWRGAAAVGRGAAVAARERGHRGRAVVRARSRALARVRRDRAPRSPARRDDVAATIFATTARGSSSFFSQRAAPTAPPPSRRFLYAFGGVGVYIVLTAALGLCGAGTRSCACCLKPYACMVVALLLAQAVVVAAAFLARGDFRTLPKARSTHWFPYDRVGVVNAVSQGLRPAILSAHPTVSIPDLDAFQRQLTPLNSTPTSLRIERRRRTSPGTKSARGTSFTTGCRSWSASPSRCSRYRYCPFRSRWG